MGIQVQELTQNLMPWDKEYIDFSFAGRHISEFGLVAVTSGDRYQFAASPEFQDETTTVNGVMGQYYWGTNFKIKTYSYSLATDGMTERQFDDFKQHFRPGKYGQFYEDTWFERYCYVRLKSVVEFSFIPFQEEIEIAGIKVTSRIYKGEAKISFIQDRPFMYSFYQVLNSSLEDLRNNLSGDNRQAALRMMYHSNIPAADSWDKNIKCSTGSIFSLPAKNNQQDKLSTYKKASSICFYNPSTISSDGHLSFTIQRSLTPVNTQNWMPVYFNEISNDYTSDSSPYNKIKISNPISSKLPFNLNNINKSYSNEFYYTLPEINLEINKAINIAWDFYNINKKGALVDLQKRFQEEMINGEVLFWAIKILQKIQTIFEFYTAEEYEIGSAPINETLVEKLEDPTQGTIIFHGGDKEENVVEEEDYIGCLKAGLITVFPFFLNNSIEVDWFGYFNIMMLMLFGSFNLACVDIMDEKNYTGFYSYSLVFNGEEGKVSFSGAINSVDDHEIVTKKEIVDKNCSNIVHSSFLKVDGGDKLALDTGKVDSYHVLTFTKGDNTVLEVENIKLEYKYTYI